MITSIIAFGMLLIDEPDEQEKFQFLYENYESEMIRTAVSILNDYGLAEDAVQESFLRIASIISSVDLSNNPRSFALTVVSNTARKIAMQNNREKYCNIDSVYCTFSDMRMIEKIENKDVIESISRFVMTLDPIYIDIFELKILHKFQYKDISKALDTPEATLRKRMQRLKELIAKFLDGGNC